MFSGLKNFAIDKILRHVADNAKLNLWTNWIAVALLAALGANANWMLIVGYFSHQTPQGLHEIIRVAVAVITALLLYLTGKFPWLKQWLPVAEDILQEAAKEAGQSNDGPDPKNH
jgi:hypothetical protein